jgi:hypothetical protein
MRSSASPRAVEGHGRNLDFALTSPVSPPLPHPPSIPSEGPQFNRPPHGEIKTGVWRPSLQLTRSKRPTLSGWFVNFYYYPARDAVHSEPFFLLTLMYDA